MFKQTVERWVENLRKTTKSVSEETKAAYQELAKLALEVLKCDQPKMQQDEYEQRKKLVDLLLRLVNETKVDPTVSGSVSAVLQADIDAFKSRLSSEQLMMKFARMEKECAGWMDKARRLEAQEVQLQKDRKDALEAWRTQKEKHDAMILEKNGLGSELEQLRNDNRKLQEENEGLRQ